MLSGKPLGKAKVEDKADKSAFDRYAFLGVPLPGGFGNSLLLPHGLHVRPEAP
jgi:hypothetical protein